MGLGSGVAQAQTAVGPWTEAQACLSESDVPICWLRNTIRRVGPGLLAYDPDLRDRPEILTLVGATVPAGLLEPGADPRESPTPETKPFVDAVNAAASATRAGSDPEAVLAALQALPVTGGYAMINPLQEGVFSFGRLDAYQMFATALMQPGVHTPEAERLVPAILAAWEVDLAGADEAAVLGADSGTLVALYAQRDDTAAARRVLARLSPENEPALINGLIDLHLFEAAAAVSDGADPAHRLGRLHRRRAVLEQVAAAQRAGFAAAQKAAFEEAFADLTPRERARLLAMEREAAPEEPMEDAAELEEMFAQTAAADLATARDRLLIEADRAGKAALVRSTARQVFDQAMRRSDVFGSGASLARALTLLVQVSDPPEAMALTEQAEAHARTRRDSHLQLLLPAIHAAWLRLGQPERAEALIEEWRPLAAAQGRAFAESRGSEGVLSGDGQPGATQGLQAILVSQDDIAGAQALGWLSPDTALRRDFAAGRGLSRLDTDLAASSADGRGQILISCWNLALEARDPVSAAVCAERFDDLADTSNGRSIAADALLRVAAGAAAKDDVPTAYRLTQRALTTGSTLEQADPAALPHSFSLDTQLREVAKAMLRSQGRLPHLSTTGR